MKTGGAFGIIFDNEGKVLLVQRRDRDIWEMPGGRIELGESPWEAVVREIREETGLTVKPIRLVGLYHKPAKDDLVFSFECRVISGTLTESEETRAIHYFPIDSLPIQHPDKRNERIKDALANLGQAVCRDQTELVPEGLDVCLGGDL